MSLLYYNLMEHFVINEISVSLKPSMLKFLIVWLFIFRRCTLLSCTTKGNASMRSIEFSSSSSRDASTNLVKTWKVCGSGDVMCSKVDGSETHALFGG